EGELPPRLNIHRRAECPTDRTLTEKLLKAVHLIKQRANERQWAVDWDAFDEHHTLAEKAHAEENWPACFRENCRALRILSEALRRHRHKEEVFQPLWDKHGA